MTPQAIESANKIQGKRKYKCRRKKEKRTPWDEHCHYKMIKANACGYQNESEFQADCFVALKIMLAHHGYRIEANSLVGVSGKRCDLAVYKGDSCLHIIELKFWGRDEIRGLEQAEKYASSMNRIQPRYYGYSMVTFQCYCATRHTVHEVVEDTLRLLDQGWKRRNWYNPEVLDYQI